MLGLECYGSDQSDSEAPAQPTPPQPLPSSLKSTLSHPPPSNTTKTPSVQSSKIKSKRPVFTVAKLSRTFSSDEDDDVHKRAAKKPRIGSLKGAGSSSLLAMLPVPSKVTTTPSAPQRVLGSAAQHGGGTGVIVSSSVDDLTNSETFFDFSARGRDDVAVSSSSLGIEKTNCPAPSKEPSSAASEFDFFSLGTSISRSSMTASDSAASAPSGACPSSISITSAPTIPTFQPPSPTPSDPYPGYYQLPSGKWAAYEPEFYNKYYESWYGSQSLDGASQKGFEGADGDNTVKINAQEQLDLARKEREDKKALTANAGRGPSAPNMNIKPPKIGSRARTRHQLSALLTEAYENREALEEKIAQGRRNRKEAGNKYGF